MNWVTTKKIKRAAARKCRVSEPFGDAVQRPRLELIEEYTVRDASRVGIDKQRGGWAHKIISDTEWPAAGRQHCGSAIASRRAEGAFRRVDRQSDRTRRAAVQVQSSAVDNRSSRIGREYDFAGSVLLKREGLLLV